jgi:carbonic anhydrase/acetyltransferase-like protein (isoleucine patch superfamily)
MASTMSALVGGLATVTGFGAVVAAGAEVAAGAVVGAAAGWQAARAIERTITAIKTFNNLERILLSLKMFRLLKKDSLVFGELLDLR